MDDILSGITDLIGGWIDGLGNLIGDLGIDDILSNLIGIIPRGIVYIRSVFQPIYMFIDTVFGLYSALLFFTCLGFLVVLAFRRGVKG